MDFFPETFTPELVEAEFNKKSDEKISKFMVEFKEKYNEKENIFMINIKQNRFTTYEINKIIERIKKEPFYTDSHRIRILSFRNDKETSILFNFGDICIYKNEDAIQTYTDYSFNHSRKYVYELITKKTLESRHEYTFEIPYKIYIKEIPKFIQELKNLGWYVECTNKWNIVDDDFYVPIIKMRQRLETDDTSPKKEENEQEKLKEKFRGMYKSLDTIKEDIDGVML